MRWFVPFSKLSPRQVQTIQEASRTLDRGHWLQGFAGSGKTVVLTHLMEGVVRTHPSASITFITYTHALKDMVASGLQEEVAQRIRIQTHTQFLRERKHHDFVFLDEVQDITADDLKRIRALAGRLCIAGDPDQRIYGERATANEIMTIATPKVSRLLEVFRLTERLRAIALRVLPSARVVEGEMAGKTADVTIRIARAVNGTNGDPAVEIAWVWKEAVQHAKAGTPSVILFTTHNEIRAFAAELASRLGLPPPPRPARSARSSRAQNVTTYDDFNAFWKQHDIPLMFLGSSFGSFTDSEHQPLVYLMTIHSSKGLDFENVFIPRMDEDAVIVSDSAQRNDPDLARRLLFVAVTRSRRNLFITHSSPRPHPFLAELPRDAAVYTRVTAQDAAPPEEEEFF